MRTQATAGFTTPVVWSPMLISANPGCAMSDAPIAPLNWLLPAAIGVGRTEPFHRTDQLGLAVGTAVPFRPTARLKGCPPAVTALGLGARVSGPWPFKAEQTQAMSSSRA